MRRNAVARRCLLGITTSSILACGPPPSENRDEVVGPQASVTDSLGVSIVEYESLEGADAGSWRVSLSDSVRIGRWGALLDDPTYLFGRTVGWVRLSDGRIAVADRLAHSIRVFEPDGSFAESIGRKGEGPGEFTEILRFLRVAADSLLVVDRGARWTLLDPAGRFVQSGRFDLTPWPGDTYPTVEGAFLDGTLLVSHGTRSTNTRLPDAEGVVSMETSGDFARADRFGTHLADFGRLPGRALLYLETAPLGSERAGVWRSSWGPYHFARGTHLFAVDSALREVRVFGPDGNLKRIFRVSGDALESVPSQFPEDFPGNVASVLQDIRRAIGPSPFSDFTVDAGGSMWFREAVSLDSQQAALARWYVFDQEGRFRTTVLLPTGWRAGQPPGSLTIGIDYVLAREHNELREETLVLVPLLRQ